MTMIERVAAALWADRFPDDAWEEAGAIEQENFRGHARAAIEAMREPSIDMEIAGTEVWLTKRKMESRALACWQAMIDSILQENRG